MGLDIYCYKIEDTEALYFRKVNFLWSFCHDLGYDPECGCNLSTEDIDTLIYRCLSVLEAKSQKVSEELLPTTSGCFFGNIEYDEEYYKDVQDVYNKFSKFRTENPTCGLFIEFSY